MRPMVLVVLALAAAASCSTGRGAQLPAPTAAPSGPPSGSASPTASGTPSPAPAGRSFTLVASGDVLVHPGVWTRARRDGEKAGRSYDFLPMFRQIRPHVAAADVAICHMEVPLGAPGAAPAGFPLFSAPPEVADALGRMGYDSCSTASNHAIDRGAEGVTRTLEAFDAAGVRHAGTAGSQAERDAPTILDADGVRVAHLSYTYGHNNVRPADKPWLVNVLADGSIVADAEAARAAGAEVVVVSIHWGTEYVHDPDPAQTALAAELMASPAVDLVLGHHAHVVQPIARFPHDTLGDRYVAYGMGNVISAASHDFAGGASREGILPEFTFEEGPDGRFRVTRVLVTPCTWTRSAVCTRSTLLPPSSPGGRARTSRGCGWPASGPRGRCMRSVRRPMW